MRHHLHSLNVLPDENRLRKLAGQGESAGSQYKSAPAIELPDHPLADPVLKELREVYDPEIPVNIVDLGLVYRINISPTGGVAVEMTLTSPGCPVADMLVQEVATRVQAVAGVASARVQLVWEPPWRPTRMTEAARLQLGL